METTIKLIEGYWTDEKLNKWCVSSYTEEEARFCSTSLENCQDCQGCQNCQDCQDYTDNPLRFVGPRMGSRNDNPTVYWLGSNVQCVVGCFRGNLDELEIKVHETHAANPEHLKAYLQFIAVARNLIKETSTH